MYNWFKISWKFRFCFSWKHVVSSSQVSIFWSLKVAKSQKYFYFPPIFKKMHELNSLKSGINVRFKIRKQVLINVACTVWSVNDGVPGNPPRISGNPSQGSRQYPFFLFDKMFWKKKYIVSPLSIWTAFFQFSSLKYQFDELDFFPSLKPAGYFCQFHG